jgi:ketosteroid isomerase-like protein
VQTILISKSVCVCAMLVLLATSARSSDTKTTGEVERTIARLEEQSVRLTKAGDTAGGAAMLADDYVGTEIDGTVIDKAGAVAIMKEWKRFKIETLEQSNLKVTVIGNKAIATGECELKATSPDGKSFHGHIYFSDTWAKMASGKWLLVEEHSFQPLSFFVGSWVQSIGDQRDRVLGGTFLQSKSVRMIVANSEKNGELSISGSCETFERRGKMGKQWGNPNIITESSTFKGTIMKMGSEYKYSIDTEKCNASFVNVRNATGEYLDTQDNVACHSGWSAWSCPSPKTYTLKITSDDEVVLVYKPTGEEVGTFKRE